MLTHLKEEQEVIVVGSGIAGLTAACLLVNKGKKVTVLEQNWLPGGCASAYPRKHYIFESGATTLVGLKGNMPLQYLLDKIGLEIPAIELAVPMKVYLKDGEMLTRHKNLDIWIKEAERVFGIKGQRKFWESCFKISQFVWNTSLEQKVFPPSSFKDLLAMAKNFRPRQLRYAHLALRSMKQFLAEHDLLGDKRFVDFVNEQLLISAQNHIDEVNVLFGATALCYTNYPNYYVEGGLINLVKPLVQYIEDHGGEVVLREKVENIRPNGSSYYVKTKKKGWRAKHVVSSIPINNTLNLFEGNGIREKYKKQILGSSQLNSAFSMGIVFKKKRDFGCIHHQIHLEKRLPYLNSDSIFLSLSHPADTLRCGANEVVASISTHVHDPAHRIIENKGLIEKEVVRVLEEKGFLRKEDIIFQHASTPKAWKKWTGRSWGFVGGYPQYMSIKPWQMKDARLDHRGAYICGDSTYPGQGIPGACLSGIVAVEKMMRDKW